MEIISYEYTKARKDFGHHPSFTDSAPTTESIRPKDDKVSDPVDKLGT